MPEKRKQIKNKSNYVNINLQKLRSKIGRSKDGSKNRIDIKISITPVTARMLFMAIPFGKGKYGSAFIEMAILLTLALFGNGEDIEYVSLLIREIMEDDSFQNNMETLKKLID